MRNALDSVQISSTNLDIEFICVKVKIGQSSVLLTCSYLPPPSIPSKYLKHSTIISGIIKDCNAKDLVCCLGDFNLKDVNWIKDYDNPTILHPLFANDFIVPLDNLRFDEDFLNTITSNMLYQVNCFSNSRNRFLDLIFVSDSSNVSVTSGFSPVKTMFLLHYHSC